MPLAIVDLDFARQQLALTLRARYIHPSGQIPAYLYYGDTFKVECPTGCGHQMNLFEVSREIANRLTRIFLRDEHGRRPVYGGTERFQSDPHWRDYVLFNEYFHGDNGAGLGASHQTGWTGLVALAIELYGRIDGERLLKVGTSPGREGADVVSEAVGARR